jgi:hypothetical protein
MSIGPIQHHGPVDGNRDHHRSVAILMRRIKPLDNLRVLLGQVVAFPDIPKHVWPDVGCPDESSGSKNSSDEL